MLALTKGGYPPPSSSYIPSAPQSFLLILLIFVVSYWVPWLSPSSEDQYGTLPGLKGTEGVQGKPWTPYPRPLNPPSKAPTKYETFGDQTQLYSCYSPSETPYITGTSLIELVSDIFARNRFTRVMGIN